MASPSPKVARHVAFYEAARDQGSCQVTGETGPDWNAHHVVYEKHLVRLKLPLYDGRNSLRVDVRAHARHHTAYRVIRTVELRQENIDYAVAILRGKERAAQYLRHYYDDHTVPDPRLEELCPTT